MLSCPWSLLFVHQELGPARSILGPDPSQPTGLLELFKITKRQLLAWRWCRNQMLRSEFLVHTHLPRQTLILRRRRAGQALHACDSRTRFCVMQSLYVPQRKVELWARDTKPWFCATGGKGRGITPLYDSIARWLSWQSHMVWL